MKTYPGKVAMAWQPTWTCPDRRELRGIRGGERERWNRRVKSRRRDTGRTRPLASCYQARSDTVTNNSAYLPQRRNLLRKGYAPTERLLPAAGPFTNLLPSTVHRLVPPTSHRTIVVQ